MGFSLGFQVEAIGGSGSNLRQLRCESSRHDYML